MSAPEKTAVFAVLTALLAAFPMRSDYTDALAVGIVLALAAAGRLVWRHNRLAAAHSRPQR
jgi:hypothetical protein